MLKISQVLILSLSIFFSCKGQNFKGTACVRQFENARDIAYQNPTDNAALDSALQLANESMGCDSIRKEVVEFKISLLLAMAKYDEGLKFVDSLKGSDFVYNYKKNLMYKNFLALSLNEKKDTVSRNLVYDQMADDIEENIKKPGITEEELMEASTELFAIFQNYLDADQINNKADSLTKLYPEKKTFFAGFKK